MESILHSSYESDGWTFFPQMQCLTLIHQGSMSLANDRLHGVQTGQVTFPAVRSQNLAFSQHSVWMECQQLAPFSASLGKGFFTLSLLDIWRKTGIPLLESRLPPGSCVSLFPWKKPRPWQQEMILWTVHLTSLGLGFMLMAAGGMGVSANPFLFYIKWQPCVCFIYPSKLELFVQCHMSKGPVLAWVLWRWGLFVLAVVPVSFWLHLRDLGRVRAQLSSCSPQVYLLVNLSLAVNSYIPWQSILPGTWSEILRLLESVFSFRVWGLWHCNDLRSPTVQLQRKAAFTCLTRARNGRDGRG